MSYPDKDDVKSILIILEIGLSMLALSALLISFIYYTETGDYSDWFIIGLSAVGATALIDAIRGLL